MAPGERLPKAARKDQNCPLPKLCFTAQLRAKGSRIKKDPKTELLLPKTKSRKLGVSPGRARGGCGAEPGPHQHSKAWEHISELGRTSHLAL